MTENRDEVSAQTLLTKWLKGLRIQHIAHSRTAVRFRRRGRLLGIPVIVLNTLVGTSIFATLESAPGTGWKILVALLSASAAVLAGLQTFLGYPELAELHKSTAQRYGRLRREVEQFFAAGRAKDGDVDGYLTSVRERWDELDEQSPTTPQEVYDTAKSEVV